MIFLVTNLITVADSHITQKISLRLELGDDQERGREEEGDEEADEGEDDRHLDCDLVLVRMDDVPGECLMIS